MTNEEAIKSIEDIRHKFLSQYGEETIISIPIDGDDMQAFDMAITALEQEPCEDCISRKRVVQWLEGATDDSIEHAIDSNLEFMPSVQPKAKWIPINGRRYRMTIEISDKTLKKRTGRFVVYDVDYLLKHLAQEVALLYNSNNRKVSRFESEKFWEEIEQVREGEN